MTPERAQAGQSLPPVTVDCGRCSAQFLSRARHMVPVHCPRCGHSVRVRREASGGHRAAASPPAPAREPPAALPRGDVGGPAGDDDDDDGETYMYDETGRLVLAEWTEDGRLVPAARPPQDGGIAAAASVQPQRWTWADGFAVLGWRLSPQPGGCQVRDEDDLRCGADTSSPPVTDGRIATGWLCGKHYAILCEVITDHNRRTG